MPTSVSGLSQRAAWAEPPPISELMALALDSPHLVSLAAGFVDQHTLPQAEVQEAIVRIFSDAQRGRAALQYGSTPGHDGLRQQILDDVVQKDFRGAPSGISLDQVVLTAGSNQLLHLVAETLLDPGDIVLCAAPTYFVFLGMLDNLGARAVGVAADAEGMIPEALEETFARLARAGERHRIKAVYLVPYFDNPGGTTIPTRRMRQLLQITQEAASSFRVRLIADEAYRLLSYGGDVPVSSRPLDPDGETVIVAGTFSKSFSPGVRVGWGILPPELVAPINHQKGNIDFGSPYLSQCLMHDVLATGGLAGHLGVLREAYGRKLNATLSSAEEYLAPLGVRWVVPGGGLYLWLELPEGMDASLNGRLFQLAHDEQVLYVPGGLCFPREGEPVRLNSMRVSFGVQSEQNIRRGVASLARAIRRWQETQDCDARR